MALITTAFLDSKQYGFEWLRLVTQLTAPYEGIFAAGDYLVTPAAAGGQRVDVAAGTALVQGDTGTRNGLYLQVNDAAIASAATLNASDPALPRLDQIVLRVRDSSDLGDASDTPSIDVVTGTPTAGATLDNRNGAAALPANALRLADVLVPAASSAVTAGNVRSRRKKALPGELGYVEQTGTSQTGIGGFPGVAITGISVQPLEYDGPVLTELFLFNLFDATDNIFGDAQIAQDGTVLGAQRSGLGVGDQGSGFNVKKRLASLTTGSTFTGRAYVSAGSGTLDNSGPNFLHVIGL